jgi:peptidoglycan-N-acetylglucosamine deacetylase
VKQGRRVYKRLALVVGLILAVLAVLLFWPNLASESLATLSPRIVWRATTGEARIAISFDDGPDPIYTPQILRILASNNIKATFFLVGERARSYPQIVEAIRLAGHEIGNHTDTWHRTVTLPLKQFEQDLVRAESTLELSTASRKYWRPAGIWARPNQIDAANRRGYTAVLGSAFAFDPLRPPASFIVWEISRALCPGAIVVLHDSGGDRTHTVQALPRIIEAAKARRLEFATLSQILGEP